MAERDPAPVSQSQPGVLWTRVLPAALVLLFAAQCAWFVGTQSLTLDEPANSLIGRAAWQHGSLKKHDDNPPLGRLWLSLPILGDQWHISMENYHSIREIRPDPESFAWRIRAMSVVLGLLLGWLVWIVSRHFWGIRGGNLGLGLWAFSPCLLAHFSVANLDGAAALMTFAVAWQVIRFRNRSSWVQAALLGILLGAHLATKHSAVPTAALALLLALVGPREMTFRPGRWAWVKTACIAGMASFVLWGAYLFHVSTVSVERGLATVTFPNTEVALHKTIPWKLSFAAYLPAGEYFTGLANILENSHRGYRTSVAGEFYEGGRWYYFPLVLVLKWPPLVLLLAATTVAGVALGRLPWHRDFALMLGFPALYFLLAMNSNMNLGDRHILPVYPFLLVLAAGVAQLRLPWQKGGAVVLAGLLSLQAMDTLRYAPDYYSYFNPLVEPAESYRWLAGGNLDGGQGLLALRRYEREHPEEAISVYYVGSVDPSAYGIRAARLADGARPRGTVAVSARVLGGRAPDDPRSWGWILRCGRKTILNHTLYVFDVAGECSSPHSP